MRLAVIDSSNSGFDVDFGYDGQQMVLEGLSSSRTRRYVYGPGGDEPLVAYLVTPGVGTSRLWYQGDERGSITRLSNDAGTPGGIGKFDEYGVGGTSRFRYTGQYWLGEANLLYYRARVYDARLGRFLQPDPIGYGAGMNMYAYVGGDPVNFIDPMGLQADVIEPDIVVTGKRLKEVDIIVSGGTDAVAFAMNFVGGAAAPPAGGRAGGPARKPAPKPKKVDPKPKKPTTCDRVASESGVVFVDFVEGSAFAGYGVTGSVGVFYNLKTGSGGFFHTEGGGLGYDLGVGIKGGFYGSAADLRGINLNINGSYGVSGSANFSKDGRLVGGSAGPTAEVGGSATVTNTTFFACYYSGGD